MKTVDISTTRLKFVVEQERRRLRQTVYRNSIWLHAEQSTRIIRAELTKHRKHVIDPIAMRICGTFYSKGQRTEVYTLLEQLYEQVVNEIIEEEFLCRLLR